MISYKNETKSCSQQTYGNIRACLYHTVIPRLVSVSSVRMLHDINVLLPDRNHLAGFRVTARPVLVLKEAEKDG